VVNFIWYLVLFCLGGGSLFAAMDWMVFAPTGTEGAEGQGTEGLGSQEKWKEMSLVTRL
jgi:hypothetical protein